MFFLFVVVIAQGGDFHSSKEREISKELIDHYHNMIKSSFHILAFLLTTMEEPLIPFIIKLPVTFKKLHDNGDFIEETRTTLWRGS